ncbi:MAG: RNA polymerase sigma factor [Acidimicrobiales bacterium]
MVRPFEEIVAEHGAVVMRVCRALLGPHDAEDAWSETFISALRAYPDLRPDSNVRGWLVTIAHHKGIDQIRRRERAPRPTRDLPERSTRDDAPATTDGDLRAALDALPPKQRGAVIYRYLADLSYAEVGALLESSEAAARRSAADGIAKLRKDYLKGSP